MSLPAPAPLRKYDNVQAYLRHLDGPRNPVANRNSETNEPSLGWDLGAGYDGTKRLAAQGDPKGAAAVAKLVDRFRTLLEDPARPQMTASVVGPYLDVGLYAAGDPECFYHQTPAPVRDGYRIGVNVVAAGAVDAASMRLRGAAIAAAVMALAERGIPVEVWCGYIVADEPANRGSDIARTLVKVQEAGAAIDIDAFAFWCAHPAVLRRLGFRDLENDPEDAVARATHVGYGYPAPGRNMKQDAGLDLWLPFTPDVGDWKAPEDAMPWLLRILAKAGLASPKPEGTPA